MFEHHALSLRCVVTALAAAGLLTSTASIADRSGNGKPAKEAFDPLLSLSETACGPRNGGQPAVLKTLILARTETAPFQAAPMEAAGGKVPLYAGLGDLRFKVSTKNAQAQAYFDQGLRFTAGFNHAEAQRAFRAARELDPDCAMCAWGEALVLGPNINAPMLPEANAPALAALERAVALKEKASAKERALIEALQRRYSADPQAERAALDAAYADAMQAVAARYPRDDTVQALYAEAAMDTQPWDYWQAGGTQPKGRGADILRTLETVLARNPSHPHAIHLYIHAVEASTRPERALAHAKRLGALMPGAGHIVHMPAHIYYRVGMYRESLEANKKAIAADERYFETSPSDPMYRSTYYPHNIHFVMVSAQMGGDGDTAIEAARKLDAAIPVEAAKAVPAIQPIKAAPYTTHAQFAAPDAILALEAPPTDLALVKVMYHYARAVAFAEKKDPSSAQREVDAIVALESATDFKPFAEWNVPAKEVMETARHVAAGRIADAMGDLQGAARSYRTAIAIEDNLAYMEPSYWYYPVRQSLGAVLLRQGRLDEAEQAFRESLARVRNNGWALAGLAEVYRAQGNAKAEKETRAALGRAWFGSAGGPDLARL
jgi:tetratricopeptide (TPR) repeat protein